MPAQSGTTKEWGGLRGFPVSTGPLSGSRISWGALYGPCDRPGTQSASRGLCTASRTRPETQGASQDRIRKSSAFGNRKNCLIRK